MWSKEFLKVNLHATCERVLFLASPVPLVSLIIWFYASTQENRTEQLHLQTVDLQLKAILLPATETLLHNAVFQALKAFNPTLLEHKQASAINFPWNLHTHIYVYIYTYLYIYM